jgi:membrane fusion protein, multidrug efflux system
MRVLRPRMRTVGCAVALAVATSACERSVAPPPGAASPPLAPQAEAAVEVQTVRVQRGAVATVVSAPASLLARRESQIGTEVAGPIQQVFVSEGDRVEAGAPLFQIDPIPYEMALRAAQAGYDVAVAERRQLASDLQRAQTLRRQDVVSAQDLDRLTTQLAVAEARERQAEEAVGLARTNLERTTVRAPYAGSVARRLADEGTTALVQPQTVVIVLQETGELEAHAAIPESQLALVRVGDRAVLHVEGVPEPIEATVSAVSDTIDAETRTYLVRIRVPNPDWTLKAGVFAPVEIHPRQRADALVVPAEAVRSEDGRTRVMVVREGIAEAVPVEIGLGTEALVEVLRGLAEGDEVLVGHAARTIAPGMRVRAAGAPAPAA